MSEPLITIEYKDYLKLQRSQVQLNYENIHNIRRIIENNEHIKTRDDLLRVIRSLENNYQNMIDHIKGGDQNENN